MEPEGIALGDAISLITGFAKRWHESAFPQRRRLTVQTLRSSGNARLFRAQEGRGGRGGG